MPYLNLINIEVQRIDEFLSLISEIENGGTLILNGCHVFSDEKGLKFSNAILEITGKRIHVIGSQDYVKESPSTTQIFNGGFISPVDDIETKGYLKDSEETGKDIQLNGTGSEIFQLIPIQDEK